jgi:hypothetical protein
MTNNQQPSLTLPQTSSDVVEQVAVAIERTMFAPHEFPLDQELHRKYRVTAKAAIDAMRRGGVSIGAEGAAGYYSIQKGEVR